MYCRKNVLQEKSDSETTSSESYFSPWASPLQPSPSPSNLPSPLSPSAGFYYPLTLGTPSPSPVNHSWQLRKNFPERVQIPVARRKLRMDSIEKVHSKALKGQLTE